MKMTIFALVVGGINFSTDNVQLVEPPEYNKHYWKICFYGGDFIITTEKVTASFKGEG